mmetsp:Transcript_67978/g.180887  ORF Transcript_67978/g.180887 Transcript_67978/m.180887 type:complete len:215 (+) Transcript_67978:807-1451(+)
MRCSARLSVAPIEPKSCPLYAARGTLVDARRRSAACADAWTSSSSDWARWWNELSKTCAAVGVWPRAALDFSAATGMQKKEGLSKSDGEDELGPTLKLEYHTVLSRGEPFCESGAELPPVTRSGRPRSVAPRPRECQFWKVMAWSASMSSTWHDQWSVHSCAPSTSMRSRDWYAAKPAAWQCAIQSGRSTPTAGLLGMPGSVIGKEIQSGPDLT